MDLGLSGKRVLITGAADPIGLQCAHSFAVEGCDIALADSNVPGLKKAFAEIKKYDIGVTSHVLDLGRSEHVASLANFVPDVDIVVNNAGTIPHGGFDLVTEREWRKSWDVKVFGYIQLCRSLMPRLQSNPGSAIVNIVSMSGPLPLSSRLASASAAAAIIGFTEAAGSRRTGDEPRVVAVSPGFVLSDEMEAGLRQTASSALGSEHRWQELLPQSQPVGEPKDIANIVTFLSSPRASHISGTTISADGGYIGL